MLSLSNLSFSLSSGSTIVSDVNMRIDRGEIVGIVGPSGAGKTTLFRLITGLLSPSNGSVGIDGSDLGPVPVSRRPISFLQQSFPLYNHLTILQNVRVPLEQINDGASNRFELDVKDMLCRLNIPSECWDRRPPTLSGGEAQRVSLAKALLKPADFLLLDEPYSNVDKNLRLRINDLIHQQVNSRDQGAIIISHDEDDLLFTADRIAIMKLGHIVQVGVPEDIIQNPVSANAASIGARLGLQRIDTQQLTGSRISVASSLQIPERVSRLGWRPSAGRVEHSCEDISIDDSKGLVWVQGKVERHIDLGGKVYISILVSALTPSEYLWHGSSPQDLPAELKTGDSVYLRVAADQLYFLDSNDEVVYTSKEG